MNKKGFTLIELLAVIVILAIIALITTPLILNIVNDARKESFKNSVLSTFKASELYEASNNFEKISNDGININNQSLPIENSKFTSGKIIRNSNNQLELVNVTDGTYCAKGTKNNLIVIKGSCNEFDTTAPINTSITIDNVTSNSFRVIVSSEDLESGIKSYSYSIDGINFITKNINNHIFNNLDLNKTYTVYVKVTNSNGITTEVITKKATTNDIVLPTYSVDTSGWQVEKTVTINYPKKQTGYIYEYSIDNGDTWTLVENETTTVTFNKNGAVIARIFDGTNYKLASSYTVSGIDTTAPSVTAALSSKTTNTITVKATGADAESGVAKYEFSIDGGSYISNGTNDTYTFTGVTTGNHTVRVRVTNGSGLSTESTELTLAPNDITTPTYSIDVSGWQVQKIVTINYPARQTNFIYQYSIDGGSSWTTVTIGTTATYTFTSNGNIIARVYDGTNYKSASLYSINQIDTTAPTGVSIQLSSKTTNTITVLATGTDSESEITKYEYSIDGGTYISNGVIASYTFTNVYTGSHIVRVRLTNGSGLSTESTGLTVSPNDITVPTYSIDKSGWQTSKTVTITYPTRQTGFIYQYSIDGGSSWTTVTSGTTATHTFNGNGNIIARVYDGTNYKTASSYSVTQIDTTAPSHITWWWGPVSTNGASLYIQASDTESGIDRILCPTSTQTGNYSNWQWFNAIWDASADAYRCDITSSTFGHYGQNYATHLYIYDNVGNGGYYNQTSIYVNPNVIYLVDTVNIGDFISYTGNNGCTNCNGASVACYDGKSPTYSGWRVLTKTGSGASGTVTIVSAGMTMCTGSSGMASFATNANKYLNSTYAISARSINCEDARPYASNACTDYTTYVSNNLINIDSYYYFATQMGTSDSVFWAMNLNRFNTNGGYVFGLRPVINLKNGIIKTGGSGTSVSPYIISI